MLFYIMQTIMFDFIGDLMFKFIISLTLLIGAMTAQAEKIVLTEQNCIVFNQAVSTEYVSKKTMEILKKALSAKELYLVLDTPGGSVTAGLNFIDMIKSLNIKVHTITIFAASMGYQMVQELGNRYITPSGTLMSHRGSVGGISGQVPGELNTRVNHIQDVLDGMSKRASSRVGMSKKDYDAAIINELWVFGQQAVDQKHADSVVDVTCSPELVEGSYSESISTIFGEVHLTFSKCPLVSFPLSFSFGKNIAPENFEKVKQLVNMKKKNINLIY